MVSGHPLSTGVLHVKLTLQLNVSVSLLLMVGGEGTPVIRTVLKSSEKQSQWPRQSKREVTKKSFAPARIKYNLIKI